MNKNFNLKDFVFLAIGKKRLSLTNLEKQKIIKSGKVLKRILKENPQKLYYGINTGVGALLNEDIPEEKWEEFQANLIRSHCCGVGNSLPREVVRAMMLHMILNLKKGHSGIRLETLRLLIEMFNRDLIPVVPEIGSVGASGDLVPQAHIALALIGEGEILHKSGKRSAAAVLKAGGLKPAKLEVGEAIALLNGTSLMTSILALTVFQAKNLISIANIASALAIAALSGNPQSFEKLVHELRPHNGQKAVAEAIKKIFNGHNGNNWKFLQDAYSLRCIPQVHGPIYETILRTEEIVAKEINSFTGNPIILENEIMHGGGNFHGQILAQLADELSISLANLSAISERRIERLLNPKLSGLPPFLAKGDETNSGLMVVQYTAAALVAENKTLAAPASIHSIPVSANQEDFVSMGAFAARKCWQICKNAEYVIAIELLCAVEALDFCNDMPPKIKKIQEIFRTYVPAIKKDRVLADDIEVVFQDIFCHRPYNYLRENEFLKKVRKAIKIEI